MFNKYLKNNKKNIKKTFYFVFSILLLLSFYNFVSAQSCTYYKCDDPSNTAHNNRQETTTDPNEYNQSCKYWTCNISGASNYQYQDSSNPDDYNNACEWEECPYDSNALNYGDITTDQSSANTCVYRLCDNPDDAKYVETTTDPELAGTQCTSGCMDVNATNYNPGATIDSGSCNYSGCMDTTANNYDMYATEDDGSCTYDEPIVGCMDIDATNYNASAEEADNELCVFEGCTDPDANNYDSNIAGKIYGTITNTGCTYDEEIVGCTDSVANNYNPSATVSDGSCNYDVSGCTDPDANNYNPTATINDGSCTYGGGGGGGGTPSNPGCTDTTASNYDPSATEDDGSCTYAPDPIYGCTNPSANNYNSEATIDDNTCMFDSYGCTDPFATNYNANATLNDGSCTYE